MSKRADPRWKVGDWKGHPNYECQVQLPNGKQCPFATLDRGRMVLHAANRHPLASENPAAAEQASNPLAGIDFASDEASEAAAELAADEVLTLRSQTPSGKTGYTVADVRAVRATDTDESTPPEADGDDETADDDAATTPEED